jgi:hypothetical protein
MNLIKGDQGYLIFYHLNQIYTTYYLSCWNVINVLTANKATTAMVRSIKNIVACTISPAIAGVIIFGRYLNHKGHLGYTKGTKFLHCHFIKLERS